MVAVLHTRLFVITLSAELLLLCISPIVFAQSSEFQFDHLTTKDGLSHNEVLAIYHDSRGFMWFGTREGLNRYDGHTIKTYGNIRGDTTSLLSNKAWDIREDRNGNLWIAGEALHKYDRDNDNFVRYSPDPDNPRRPHGWVRRFCERVWDTGR